MGQLKEQDLSKFLKSGAARSNGILFYGTDESAISASVGQVVRSWKDAEQPLRISASSLKDDGAALDDAFRALSLLGDRRLIIVDGVEEIHAKYLLPLIGEVQVCNFLVLVAGSLNKSSKLREASSSSGLFESIGIYEETDEAFMIRIRNILAGHGLQFADSADDRFFALCGSDRSIAVNELEKLALYCWPEKLVTEQDVIASCGDQASFDADALIAAVMDGNLPVVDRVYESMRAGGEWRQALVLLQMHVARLQSLRAALDNGQTLENAFRSVKPPVFFNQQGALGRQARSLSLDVLFAMDAAVQQATLASRQQPDLAESLVSRTLLTLARQARMARQNRAA